jgi:uncharacterized protein YndB with AHSA1/START domain
MAKAPLIFTYYIAAPVEKVWDGFVSMSGRRTIRRMLRTQMVGRGFFRD